MKLTRLDRWMGVVGGGIFVGLVSAIVLSSFLFAMVGEPNTGLKVIILLSGSLIVGMAVGACIAYPQYRFLRKQLAISWQQWLGGTALAGIIITCIGNVPQLLIARSGGAVLPGQLSWVLVGFYSMLIGIGVGLVFGICQWLSLRAVEPQAKNWIRANFIAWGVGAPLLIASSRILTSSVTLLQALLIFTFLLGIFSLIIASITGRVAVNFGSIPDDKMFDA